MVRKNEEQKIITTKYQTSCLLFTKNKITNNKLSGLSRSRKRQTTMRIINADTLKSILANLPSNPRIIASGNFATPQTLLAIAEEVIPRFKLHIFNANGKGIPDREGITYETSFIGPALRNHPRLEYIPSRLSLISKKF